MFEVKEVDSIDNIRFRQHCNYYLEANDVFNERVEDLKRIGWHTEAISSYSLGFREIEFNNGVKVIMSPL